MRQARILSSYFLIALIISILPIFQSYGQVGYTGDWEGTFMDDFRVVIHVEMNDSGQQIGSILTFDDYQMIQDDKLSQIEFTDSTCTFYIPDKETFFKGRLKEAGYELVGNLVFPDGSMHLLQVYRKDIEAYKPVDLNTLYTSFRREIYSAEDLSADLSFLYLNILKYHPRPFAHVSEDSLEQIYNHLLKSISEDMTLSSFYLVSASLVNAVQCSHTAIRIPLNCQLAIDSLGVFFPLRLFFADDRAYYVSSFCASQPAVKPGTEIISINNQPVKEVIRTLSKLIPSEGNNKTTDYQDLNRRFNILYYYLDQSKTFRVHFKAQPPVDQFSVLACRHPSQWSSYDLSHEGALKVDYMEDVSTVLLTIPTFAIKNMEEYLAQLENLFLDLQAKDIQNLILDLRNNEGGHPIFSAQLLSYLTDNEFIYFKRNEDVHDFEPLYNTMQPNQLHFKGNLYVMVNGKCLSTTGHLISLLKFHTNALFIGESPGSTYTCNDFSVKLSLPHTNLEVNIPKTVFETEVSGFNMYIPFPIDEEVSNTLESILQDKDAVLDYVLYLIRSE